MNGKEKILERLATQEDTEGRTENIRHLMKILKHVKMQSEWDAFVQIEHKKYGPLSYECHIFYYVKPHMLKLLKDFLTEEKTFTFDYDGHDFNATVKVKSDDIELLELSGGIDLYERSAHLIRCVEEKALEVAYEKFVEGK